MKMQVSELEKLSKKELIDIILILADKVEQLTAKVEELSKKLKKYEHPKDSNNSSIPPSKDENRPKRSSLREKSDKKVGGQLGHEGKTLKMTSNPDKIIPHIPDYCIHCGEDLTNVEAQFINKRQLIDIEIKPIYTEHQVFGKQCKCGNVTSGTYPSDVNAPIQYGSTIESLVAYYHSRQYLPFHRMQEMFNDVFRIPICIGSINNLLDRFTEKAMPVYQRIKQELFNSKVVGTDETGTKINGDKYWSWTWQNDKNTYIAISDNRGTKTIEKEFPDGFPKSILIHDCWRSHISTIAIIHQLCMAHLQRDLNYLTELYNHKWSIDIKNLLKEALGLKKTMNENNYQNENPLRQSIENKLDELLSQRIDDKYKELNTFQKRLKKNRHYIFPFLYYEKVPPDNNGSERAIRNIKVKQKISGQFKSTSGAEIFTVIRSVIDTIIKRGQNVIYGLNLIAKFVPE